MPKKGVFFDRDGTLIVDKIYLNDPEQIVYLPGAFEALRRLRDDGYEFVVVTNQSGLARDLVQIQNLDEIHRRIAEEFARNGVFFAAFHYAPYSVESGHWMRKPNPGMLETAAREHGFDVSRSWMVGDRMTDVEAGRRAGMRTVLLRNEVGQAGSDPEGAPAPTVIASGLLDAAAQVLAHDAP